MSFLDNLKQLDNLAFTTNGAIGHASTLNKVLDLSTKIGNSRFESITDLLVDAYTEDKILTSKLIAYARDVRGGGGDKTFGRLGFALIANNISIDKVEDLVSIIAEYGSYKDIMYLLDENVVKSEVVREICGTLELILRLDVTSETPTLLAKYMPTETTKNVVMKNAYRTFMKYVDISPKNYRKRNTKIRKQLDIIETKLTEKRYDDIDYSKIPSQAGLKYRQAFHRNDPERYSQFLESVNNGESKINTGTLAPYQLVGKALDRWSLDDNTIKTINTMWDNMKKPDNKGFNVLPVVDTSGSMEGFPLEVAISLGLILAENMTGTFANHFMTFSERPRLQEVKGKNLVEKAKNMDKADWGMNTNLEKVFDLVLKTAVSNNTPQEELPQAIIIFSDMQFDQATRQYYNYNSLPTLDDTFYNIQKEKYIQAGYQLPTIIFWNIGYGTTKPVVENTKNTLLVSGFSQNIFDSIFNLDLNDLENYTPLKALLEVLSQERYNQVEGLYQEEDGWE